jgi:hypothetical protein
MRTTTGIITLAAIAIMAGPALAGRVQITDEATSEVVAVTDGALHSLSIDRHTLTGDVHFSQVISGSVTSSLTVATAIDDYSIEVSSGHGITNTDQLVMFSPITDRVYIGDVLSVSTNTIELDTPINAAFPADTTFVARTTKEMNVDGSTNRQIFSIAPPTDVTIHITRIMFQLITTDPIALDKFGDIDDGLVRGLVLRSSNGINVNYWNVKTNGDLVGIMYDVTPYAGDKAFNVNGLGGRITYGGESKHGAVISLSLGDTLDAIVQDDMTTLLRFHMVATYHLIN